MDSNGDIKLKKMLMYAGKILLHPAPSIHILLLHLKQLENCLRKMEQLSSKSMQKALFPSQKALVKDQLFRHSNIDVKVAVASCISEITRITAPNPPYDDDRMVEVFHLIVSLFENLDDISNRLYVKRASILEVVARVRSCVVMLDLKCNELIIEMFQHFFKTIRDYHPANVFASMETIMCLVLEESDDIAVELLSPVLASVKKGDEKVLPVARKLGEQVLQSCATKVKPYLIQAVKSLGISLDDYSDIVGSICQENSGTFEQNEIDVHAGENETYVIEFIGDDSEPEEGDAADRTSLETSFERPLKQGNSNKTKQGKVNSVPKRSEGASSSKCKSAAIKSGGKLKEVRETAGKSVDNLKPGSSKAKEVDDDDDEMSADSDEVQEMTNVNSQGSKVKNVKRRRTGNAIIEIHRGYASTRAKTEMFQHFFKTIRDYHPANVFASMETIMCLVLEESDDIAVELLSPVLACVKKGDEKVLPVARKLGEQVLQSCATKVKPYLIRAVKSLGISLDDYSDIVGSICQETSGTFAQNENDVHAGENKVSSLV